jgi:alcohol dehydrogenase class IV
VTDLNFIHETLPQRVVFATGTAAEATAAEVDRLGARRVMVIAAPGRDASVETIAAGLPIAVRYSEVVMHVPVEVAERARESAAAHAVDALVCVGGGSTTGLAKAIALSTGLPIVAVPTTYAGSEATNVWGLTEAGVKTTGVDDAVLPRAVVYDASLTLTLPVDVSVASGLNAMAHCVDAMWGPRTDPIDQALAADGITSLAAGLPAIVADPADLAGRERTLYGAYLAAVAFTGAGSGLHHKICHVLGGAFNLPHAPTHAVVLPYVLAFNGPYAVDAERRIARAFGTDSAAAGLADLRAAIDAPTALRDLGMPADGVDRATDAVLRAVPANNPAPVTATNIAALLHAAWVGSPPS